MKTTIDVPDELLQQAKLIAVQQRTTLRKIVVQGLERVTAEMRDCDEVREKKRNLLERMRASNTQAMVPLTREDIHER